MKPKEYFFVILFMLAFTFLVLVVNKANASTEGLEYDREQAIMALGYVQEPKRYLYWKGTKEGLNLNEIRRFEQIIQCESNWNPKAKSTTNDHGLAQIHAPLWPNYYGLTIQELYDPYINIDTGIKIYKRNRSFKPWSCNKII